MTSTPPVHHPAFTPPPDLNVPIWRYMEGNRFEWMVRQRRLYMTHAPNLPGDRFEGSTPVAELAWWESAAEVASTDAKRQIISANRDKLSSFQQMFRDAFYVSCWHMNEHENAMMWAAYTKTPNSVAIRSTYARLREFLPDHVEIGVVKYIDYTRDRLPSMNMYEAIMHKRHYYAFERELRAVATGLEDTTPWGKDVLANILDGGYAPRVNLNQLIDAVYVHPEATSEFYSKIKSLCAEGDLPEPVISGMSGAPVY